MKNCLKILNTKVTKTESDQNLLTPFDVKKRIDVDVKGAFRLDAKQREAKVGDLRQPSPTFANLREWGITSLAKVANLREWLLIFATGRFLG